MTEPTLDDIPDESIWPNGPGGAAVDDTDVEAALWHAVRTRADAGARAQLIERHMPLARIIAAKLYAGRFHDDVEFDDYHQMATIGLIEAVDRYDPELGARFRTFASMRVRGAVLNGLDRMSERQQQISTRQRLRTERAASLAPEEMPDGSAQLLHTLAEAGIGLALGMLLEGTSLFAEENSVSPTPAPYAAVELDQLRKRVKALVDLLPERERRIIQSHYLQQIPFEQIASVLGVTRGRVAQLHKQALNRMREAARHVPPRDAAW
ncbi:flagellar biosynthesis sigma factor [Pandoraea communis]|uniref:Flagellar biosynthesis sigma factor n=1 Tax=Pandoraea communis TaxID=2508297 RepID=A0A5E4YQ94_9BURK|nr:sigma-70 family RNA polymerase sigma factor [Pandoraea communis]VVE50667.1 flagellar biosynthesis sigma factor [Pandoraea communis]